MTETGWKSGGGRSACTQHAAVSSARMAGVPAPGGSLNCNGSLCGLSFLSAWWPPGDEIFSMAGQDSKVGVPASKVEVAWLPRTRPPKP